MLTCLGCERIAAIKNSRTPLRKFRFIFTTTYGSLRQVVHAGHGTLDPFPGVRCYSVPQFRPVDDPTRTGGHRRLFSYWKSELRNAGVPSLVERLIKRVLHFTRIST